MLREVETETGSCLALMHWICNLIKYTLNLSSPFLVSILRPLQSSGENGNFGFFQKINVATKMRPTMTGEERAGTTSGK